MSKNPQPRGVHLVGSINLPTTTDVFEKVPTLLPGRLKRLPDGETGHRHLFTQWQTELFASHPQIIQHFDQQFQPIPSPPTSREEIEATISTLPELKPQWDDYALSSYTLFKQLKDQGHILTSTKFQVSLPGLVNVIALLAPPYQLPIEPLYETAFFRSLHRIQDSIPHQDLAVQFDVALEIAMLEGAGPWPSYFEPVLEGVVERLVRSVKQVEVDVEVGLHLCYGDIGHRHFVEPKDLGLVVEVANAVGERVGRPIAWVHVPVPKYRFDEAYFAPLRRLELRGAEVYLGLVHFGDEEGTRRRIQVAQKAVKEFGVATECGMGRTPVEQFEGIMEISRKVSEPVF